MPIVVSILFEFVQVSSKMFGSVATETAQIPTVRTVLLAIPTKQLQITIETSVS